MTMRNQILFWLGAFAAFLGFVSIFKSVLLPFVLGIAIAYLLNPLVRSFEKLKINRKCASLIILLLFIIFVVICFALLIPVLYRQGLELAKDMPGYIESLWAMLEPYSRKAMDAVGVSNGGDMKALLQEHSTSAALILKNLLGNLAEGGQAVISGLTLAIITPIVAYFMMKEWTRITVWVEDLLPRDHKNTITDLLEQIDTKISGFVRGQISVALILAVGYAIALSVTGLKYGALIGIMSGVLSVIPMIGSTLGLLVSVAVAWFQSGELSYVAIIAAIFFAGQLIEGNILSPKIVGDSVGLHPLWVFFALFAGGALFGILGMLLAVPVAAVAGVLLAFAITQYKSSSLYKGKAKKKTAEVKK